jgi:hypothetical protein
MPIASGTWARVSNNFSNPSAGTAVDPATADALFDDYDTAVIALLELRARASADTTKNASDTLSAATGLTVTVGAGLTYAFRAILYTSSNTSGGVKFDIAGAATATAIRFHISYINNADGTWPISAAHTSLGGGGSGVTATAAGKCVIEGTITVNAGGTLLVNFAQNASHASDSKVLIGSTLVAKKIA